MPEKQDPTHRDKKTSDDLPGQQEYNLASNKIISVNVHVKDNALQALAIVVCLILGGGIGALVGEERVTAAIVGGVIGLIGGCFGSGLALMIYHAATNARGRND